MKTTILSIFFLLAANNVLAQGKHALHAFYFFNVSNPAGVVAAMDKFQASACGRRMPADIGLMAETINGSAQSTHFIIASFEEMADFAAMGPLMQSCAEAATLAQDMRAVATPVSEYAIIPAIEVGDWTEDSVFMKYDMKVSDEGAYASAWTALMDASVENGTITNSYGLNRVFLGNSEASHFVYIGASDFEALTAQEATINSSSDFSRYLRKVGGVREILNTSLITPVKSWPRQ
jgi:hypothetical protein